MKKHNTLAIWLLYFIFFLHFAAPPKTNLKISASSKMTTSTINVFWAPLTFEDASIEVTGYELQYKLVKQNGTAVKNSDHEKLILCSELVEFLLTNLTSFSQYKIQMAGIFQNGSRTFSNIVYGGKKRNLCFQFRFLCLWDILTFNPFLVQIKILYFQNTHSPKAT